MPEVRIMCDEPRRIHLKNVNKLASPTLIPIGCDINAAILLFEWLECETWEA